MGPVYTKEFICIYSYSSLHASRAICACRSASAAPAKYAIWTFVASTFPASISLRTLSSCSTDPLRDSEPDLPSTISNLLLPASAEAKCQLVIVRRGVHLRGRFGFVHSGAPMNLLIIVVQPNLPQVHSRRTCDPSAHPRRRIWVCPAAPDTSCWKSGRPHVCSEREQRPSSSPLLT